MLRTVVALALLAVLMGVTGAREAHAGGTVIVDSPLDFTLGGNGCTDGVPNNGNCPLRDAILLANAGGGTTGIIFQVGGGVPTIVLQSPLPAITQPMFMEGNSGGATRIELYGTNVPNAAALNLSDHFGSTIRNMQLDNFSNGTGILISGGGNHTIESNLIGGTQQASRNANGIFMQNTTLNTIGGAGADANVISGNFDAGVTLGPDAFDNTVAGNIIGLSADGTTSQPNNPGILVTGFDNQIGTASLPNTIAGNDGDGIQVFGPGNRVQGNFIGLNSQTVPKPNAANGVSVGESPGDPNVIGGSLQDANTISGNASAGVRIEEGSLVEVSGNIIGLSPDGTSARNNQGNGVRVVENNGLAAAGAGGVAAIEIGKPGAPNTISGNTLDGILIDGVDNVAIRDNNIGVNAARTTGLPNGIFGINVAAANDAIIERNFIAAHEEAGIFIDGRGGDAEGNDIVDNFIGGIPDIQGNGNGIEVTANNNDIEDNTIAENTFDGIIIDGDGNRITDNLIGTNDDGDFVGNGGNGIAIFGDGNFISEELNPQALPAGGFQFPFASNIIWNNGGSGVFVAQGTGNTITFNSMKDNFSGAIDLAPEGPTANDTDDPDSGANDKQNFPVLTFAAQGPGFARGSHPSGGGGFFEGSLNSTPNSEFIIDVYRQDICNETANLQPAEEWIGSFDVTTNGSGDAEFSLSAFIDMTPGDFVNATATNELGSTSELSACIEVSGTIPTATPSPSPTQSPGSTGTPTPTPSPTDVRGDADCDGDVDTDDFMAALSEVAGVPPGAPCSDNVGCEDPIDAEDALEVLKFVASPDDFPFPDC